MRISIRRLRGTFALLFCSFAIGVPHVCAQSPLEKHRQELRSSHPAISPLSGHVLAVQDGGIYTSITTDWVSAGITNGISLRVYLAGRVFDARFLSPASYAQVVTDPSARKGLDVDLVCILDPNRALVVVGLAGGLAEWLSVKPGAPISLEKK